MNLYDYAIECGELKEMQCCNCSKRTNNQEDEFHLVFDEIWCISCLMNEEEPEEEHGLTLEERNR